MRNMDKERCLKDILPGQRAVVKSLSGQCGIHRRLLDMGLTENCEVECIGQSPMGDPRAYLIRGAVIAIRSDDCKNIIICDRLP